MLKKLFVPRTTKPTNEPYYIRKVSGGYNGAIAGNPKDPVCDVLANCVGYANGRFAEIIGKDTIEYQLICNAENFIEVAKQYGLTVSKVPTLGGIMVWQKGATLSASDGAGHVAVVEEIIDDNTIVTSESGYGCKAAFWTTTRTNNNKQWGAGSAYKFRGCIVNPSDPEPAPLTAPNYFIYRGNKGANVAQLQRCLKTLGYTDAYNRPLVIDGDWGGNTDWAFREFQRKNRLVVDGIYGPKSFSALRQALNNGK